MGVLGVDGGGDGLGAGSGAAVAAGGGAAVVVDGGAAVVVVGGGVVVAGDVVVVGGEVVAGGVSFRVGTGVGEPGGGGTGVGGTGVGGTGVGGTGVGRGRLRGRLAYSRAFRLGSPAARIQDTSVARAPTGQGSAGLASASGSASGPAS